MIRLLAIYFQPQEGERFDETYYVSKHLPLVKETLPGVVSASFAKALPSPTGESPPVRGVGIVEWESTDAFQRDLTASSGFKRIKEDYSNYASCKSVVVVCEVQKV